MLEMFQTTNSLLRSQNFLEYDMVTQFHPLNNSYQLYFLAAHVVNNVKLLS
jgi:hypothetical protein